MTYRFANGSTITFGPTEGEDVMSGIFDVPQFLPEEALMLMVDRPFVIVAGESFDATAIGPFNSASDAVEWAVKTIGIDGWVPYPLVKPEDWPGGSLNVAGDDEDDPEDENGQLDLPLEG